MEKKVINHFTILIAIIFILTIPLAISHIARQTELQDKLGSKGTLYYTEDISNNVFMSLFNPRYVVIFTDKNFVTKIASVSMSPGWPGKWNISVNGYFEMYDSKVDENFKLQFANKFSELLKYKWDQKELPIIDIEKQNKTVTDYAKVLDMRNFDYGRKSELLNKSTRNQIPLYLDIDNTAALKRIKVAYDQHYASNTTLLQKIISANQSQPDSYKTLITDNLITSIADVTMFEQGLEDYGYLEDSQYYAGSLLERYKRNAFYYFGSSSISIMYIQKVEDVGLVIVIRRNFSPGNEAYADYQDKHLLVYDDNFKIIEYEGIELYP